MHVHVSQRSFSGFSDRSSAAAGTALCSPQRRTAASLWQRARQRPAAARSARISEASFELAARPAAQPTTRAHRSCSILQKMQPRRPSAATAHVAASAVSISPCVERTRPAATDESCTSISASMRARRAQLARQLACWPCVATPGGRERLAAREGNQRTADMRCHVIAE